MVLAIGRWHWHADCSSPLQLPLVNVGATDQHSASRGCCTLCTIGTEQKKESRCVMAAHGHSCAEHRVKLPSPGLWAQLMSKRHRADRRPTHLDSTAILNLFQELNTSKVSFLCDAVPWKDCRLTTLHCSKLHVCITITAAELTTHAHRSCTTCAVHYVVCVLAMLQGTP